MTATPEKRDPDEIILTPRAGVGGAGRIPVIGRVGDGAQTIDDGEPRELSEAELAADGLLDLDDEDDEDGFDLSIEASLRSIQIAWRDLYELKGALSTMQSCPGLDHAWSVVDGLDSWFDSQEKRLNLMIARRNNDGGAQ